MEKLNEPEWKHDLVKRIWVHARSLGFKDKLPQGLGNLILQIRSGCDRCGIDRKTAKKETGLDISPYQCCWVHSDTEDYCPHLCINCHHELQKQRPHATVSV